ncbi:MAG: hypothetical protein UIH27_00630 [Ruminococcus sp.]|nr:hypothetical protein [Ruminococcus sp.]
MKLMPALPESIFDICYLIFAITSGLLLLKNSRDRKELRFYGTMTLLLGCGDAFHLVPRVLNYWVSGDFTASLGIGKLITSVTMTIFYLLMEYARRERYHIEGEKPWLVTVWILSIFRIALCSFPQNGWTSAAPSLLWGILRNIPFAVLGIVTVILWLRSAKKDKTFSLMWLAVTLSFLFYIPVVLFSQALPLIGMLMLPKTCMYIWMIAMFLKANKEK